MKLVLGTGAELTTINLNAPVAVACIGGPYGELGAGRCSVTLRFQDKHDEVDRAAKEERATGVLVFMVVVLAAISGAVHWFDGKSLASYEEELGFYIGLGFLFWFLAPFYYEFRIRTKEIYGTVIENEKAISAVREDQKELLERLNAIEEEMRSMRQIPGFICAGRS